MTGLLTVMGEITETGQLVVELPPDAPRGRVVVTLGPAPEDDLELTDEDVTGLGLTAEEIAASAEMGAWADESEIGDGASYVERLRSTEPRYSW